MYTNKHGLSTLLRGIMDKRAEEGVEVTQYGSRILYKGLQGVKAALRGLPWTWTLRLLLISMAMATIAYGDGVHYGQTVRVTKGFYKGCVGTAIVKLGDNILIRGVQCGGARPWDLLISEEDLEVVK